MNITIIQVPYDCGYKDTRQGLAPDYFLKHNLVGLLEDDGHQVQVTRIDSRSAFTLEVGTAFELNRLLASEVSNAITSGNFPLVLAGNCICSLGNIAGIGSNQLGVVWFDAHGEFNTPETTLSGFLDGMPLATATGRCWKTLAKTIPGFAPVRDANVILVGARDLDDEEQRLMEQSDINLVKSGGRDDEALLQSIESGLISMQNRVTDIYLHIDMDAFEIAEGKPNHYGATGGLSVDLVGNAIEFIKRHFPIKSATIASFDPAGDTGRLFLQTGLACAKRLTAGYHNLTL